MNILTAHDKLDIDITRMEKELLITRTRLGIGKPDSNGNRLFHLYIWDNPKAVGNKLAHHKSIFAEGEYSSPNNYSITNNISYYLRLIKAAIDYHLIFEIETEKGTAEND